eukprot:scaffold293620_cov18-Tisochrysis_lutea.AAC.1
MLVYKTLSDARPFDEENVEDEKVEEGEGGGGRKAWSTKPLGPRVRCGSHGLTHDGVSCEETRDEGSRLP